MGRKAVKINSLEDKTILCPNNKLCASKNVFFDKESPVSLGHSVGLQIHDYPPIELGLIYMQI